MARALVFDVNETLLDLSVLREPFARAFGEPPPLGEWFARLLHASLVSTLTDAYEDFGALAGKALEAVAARRGVEVGEREREEVVATMRSLPPHREVPGALERLRAAGFPLATLTNSPPAMARAQLEHAGIAGLFDHVLSVEEVRRYKPAPEPYRMAAERLGLPPSEVRLVAAHDWDVWGALRAGCRGAYVARTPGPFSFGEPPDVVGPDLASVADAILAADRP
ncbi:MAG TPA: haloacid dehalogenase type II [Actinomycetota bacterium]|nr:haloacid dehalogenase type II [Actinomycetota bacterium]